MQVQNYLMFNGRTEEALKFYEKALGAQIVMLFRFKEAPEPHQPGMIPPGAEEKIMHSAFKVGETLLMASDGQCSGNAQFAGFSLSISARDEAEAERLFNALADGGQVHMALAKTFFARSFGVVVDRFGVSWMIIVEP